MPHATLEKDKGVQEKETEITEAFTLTALPGHACTGMMGRFKINKQKATLSTSLMRKIRVQKFGFV